MSAGVQTPGVGTTPSSDPRTGAVRPGPQVTPAAQVERLAYAAANAFPVTSVAGPSTRQGWLTALADTLDAHADELVALADEETALGRDRLVGELAKTAANARYYGAVGASGRWLRAVVERLPGPPPMMLARAHLPIGPVAVFGASNFPFQFGAVGHDVCSALAVGCPVVVKAHPAHPRLSARLAELAVEALTGAGAPTGTYAMVHGLDAGLALVDADAIAAVGFTGSQRGGLALVARAAERDRPIPVYAEMGTVNPVLVTPAGAATPAQCQAIAEGFVGSFTLGLGQFCTKPGLLLAPQDSDVPARVAELVAGAAGGWLLTEGIAVAYATGSAALAAAGGGLLAAGSAPSTGFAAAPRVLQVDLGELERGSVLLEECFGPVALVATYAELSQAYAALAHLQPSLAGSVFAAGGEDPDLAGAVTAMSAQVGRVIVGGWPTGVACADAMQHGGPWPATSRPEATSVGGAALERWTRPVAFQDVPATALPPAMRDLAGPGAPG